MGNTRINAQPIAFDEAIVANYRQHTDAEAAVRSLVADGLPMGTMSIIGRHFETQRAHEILCNTHAVLGETSQPAARPLTSSAV